FRVISTRPGRARARFHIVAGLRTADCTDGRGGPFASYLRRRLTGDASRPTIAVLPRLAICFPRPNQKRCDMPIPPGRCRSLLVFLALLTSGCGAETYRARLNNTAQYFAYQQKRREDLGPLRTVLGVSIQAPKQFRWIDPPPPPEVDENGNTIAADGAEDPRQPHYLGLQLPGLLGSWEANVQAEVGGQDEPRKAYL